ncbi:hypothetical protein EGW08_019179 [Elysia chlorotica]|uniref:Interferon-induced transmembrane protein n=1 Tax=Elysia chlorotica TaxID=188477 RepID=A0A3S1B1Z6_ELYCH|nr:hypothetical protein EGW08_019179 [Elysia chlorotica]
MENNGYAQGEQPPPYSNEKPTAEPQLQPQPYPQPQLQPQPYGGYGYPNQPPAPGQPAVVMVAPEAQVMKAGPEVEDNMIISIVSIFFCCLLGIIATIKASDSKEALKRGDIETAQRQASTAGKLAKAAIIIGIVCCAISIVSSIISASMGSSRYD